MVFPTATNYWNSLNNLLSFPPPYQQYAWLCSLSLSPSLPSLTWRSSWNWFRNSLIFQTNPYLCYQVFWASYCKSSLNWCSDLDISFFQLFYMLFSKLQSRKSKQKLFVLLFLLMLLGFLLLFFKFCAYESFEIMIIFCCVPGGFSCLCSCVSGGLFMLLVFFKLLFKEGKCQH